MLDRMRSEIAEAAKYHPITVGEWSVASKSIELDIDELASMSDEEQARWYRRYSDAQLDAWDVSSGGFFTTLRVSDTDTDVRRRPWSFEWCVEHGWIDLRHGM